MRILTRVPNLGRLLAFREVARAASFSEAAVNLSVSQSAVSQRVASLERELGLNLIDRARGRVGLTEPGRFLVARVENALAQLSAADIELDTYRTSPAASIRVGAFSTAMWRLLPEAVSAFRTTTSGLTVAVHRTDTRRAVSALKAGELDLALIVESPAVLADVADGTLETTHLFDERVFVALPAGHRLAARPSLTPADLAGETWLHGRGHGAIVVGAGQRGAAASQFALASDDQDAAISFTAARLGLAFVGELGMPFVPEAVVVRGLVPEPSPRRIALAELAVRRTSAAASGMRAALRQAASQHLARIGHPPTEPL